MFVSASYSFTVIVGFLARQISDKYMELKTKNMVLFWFIT